MRSCSFLRRFTRESFPSATDSVKGVGLARIDSGVASVVAFPILPLSDAALLPDLRTQLQIFEWRGDQGRRRLWLAIAARARSTSFLYKSRRRTGGRVTFSIGCAETIEDADSCLQRIQHRFTRCRAISHQVRTASDSDASSSDRRDRTTHESPRSRRPPGSCAASRPPRTALRLFCASATRTRRRESAPFRLPAPIQRRS